MISTDARYVVLDIETNGKHLPEGRIIEIAIVKVTNGVPGEVFQTLVNPGELLSRFITRLTGITDGMLRNAPYFDEIAAEIVKFIGNSTIVAHNASFDYRYLKAEIEKSIKNHVFDNDKVCTVALTRRTYPGLPKYNLDFLTEAFCLRNPDRHRAFGDASATAELFCRHLLPFDATGSRKPI